MANARTPVPFTRASSAGLAGKRAAACLRLVEPSSADPRQTEQRSEPEGPRSRVPGGIAKGAGQAAPFGSPEKAKGEQDGAANAEQRRDGRGCTATACRGPCMLTVVPVTMVPD